MMLPTLDYDSSILSQRCSTKFNVEKNYYIYYSEPPVCVSKQNCHIKKETVPWCYQNHCEEALTGPRPKASAEVKRYQVPEK